MDNKKVNPFTLNEHQLDGKYFPQLWWFNNSWVGLVVLNKTRDITQSDYTYSLN